MSCFRKQPGLIHNLYTGIQCSSCGIRFTAEFTIKYSSHLDWHFRQNRREKMASKTVQSRKWYYDTSDWCKYEEQEDETTRGNCFLNTFLFKILRKKHY